MKPPVAPKRLRSGGSYGEGAFISSAKRSNSLASTSETTVNARPSRAQLMTAHHAAMAVMFPLSPVATAAQKTQLPWDEATPFKGLGWRGVDMRAGGSKLQERTIART